MDDGGYVAGLCPAGSAVEQSQCGVEHHGLALHAFELFNGPLIRARLAQLVRIQHQDLVGADDERIRELPRRSLRFEHGQAQCGLRGRFAGQRAFVHIGRHDLEGQVQARQQFAPVARGGSKDKFHSGWISISAMSGVTASPLAAKTLMTMPLMGACTSFSIFIASMTRMGSPA